MMPWDKNHCETVRAKWASVRLNVKRMLAEGVEDDFTSLTTGKPFEMEHVKNDIILLLSVDPHQLLRRMESIVYEHVMRMKVDLWQYLINTDKNAKIEEIESAGTYEMTTPEQTIAFLKLLLEKFTQNYKTTNNMCTLFDSMDSCFSEIGINWRVINHHLFDSIIYREVLLKLDLTLMEEIMGCDLRGSVHDTAEQEEERRLRECSNQVPANYQQLANSFRLLRRLMLTSREIFKSADAKIMEYAKTEMNPNELRRQTAVDQEFFLSQRRYVRWLARNVPTSSGSCCREFEAAVERRFATQESMEDKEDDQAFLERLAQLFDRGGLNGLTVCAEENERDSKKAVCPKCSEEHCACDSCQLSHLIVCGISTEELNRILYLDPEDAAANGNHVCGSGLYMNRFMTRNEHLSNAYGGWEFPEVYDSESSDDEQIMCAIDEIDEATPSGGSMLKNAPAPIRAREQKLKKRRQKRERDAFHEKNPSTSSSSSEAELDLGDEPHSALDPARLFFEIESEVNALPEIPDDGCRELNEQLRKDLRDATHANAAVVPSLLREEVPVPFCCLPHRTHFRRQQVAKDRIHNLLFDCQCSQYPYTRPFNDLNLRSGNELIFPKEKFRAAYENDAIQIGYIRYSIKSLIAGYSQTMKSFYIDADVKSRKAIEDRVLKEASEAARLFGDFSCKSDQAETPENNYEYRVSDVQEKIKKIKDWAKVEVRADDRAFLKKLQDFDLSVLTALPRRGITFYFLRSIYDIVYHLRRQEYRLDSIVYQPLDPTRYHKNIDEEVQKLSLLESLWIAMVFASTVMLKTDMEFDCLQQTANFMAEYIVLAELENAENGYDPVSHFLNMCLIFRVLMKCMLVYKDTLGAYRHKTEAQLWEYEIDESGLTEQDHRPDFRNPHHLSLWQKRQLKDAKISLLEICEVNSEVINTLKKQKNFIRNRQHLRETIVLYTLLNKTRQLQEHINEEKSCGDKRHRLQKLHRLQMKQKEEPEWCMHRCEEHHRCETEEKEKDLDEIVADIEGDNGKGAKAAKKARKKRQQQARQAAEEERRRKEAEVRAVEEAEAERKAVEKAAERARQLAENEAKRREKERLREKEKEHKEKERNERDRKKKSKKKGAKKDSSPIVIEEPVYTGDGLVWQKSTSPGVSDLVAKADGGECREEPGTPAENESTASPDDSMEKPYEEESRSELSSISEAPTPLRRGMDSALMPDHFESVPTTQPEQRQSEAVHVLASSPFEQYDSFLGSGYSSSANRNPRMPPGIAMPRTSSPYNQNHARSREFDIPPGFEHLAIQLAERAKQQEQLESLQQQHHKQQQQQEQQLQQQYPPQTSHQRMSQEQLGLNPPARPQANDALMEQLRLLSIDNDSLMSMLSSMNSSGAPNATLLAGSGLPGSSLASSAPHNGLGATRPDFGAVARPLAPPTASSTPPSFSRSHSYQPPVGSSAPGASLGTGLGSSMAPRGGGNFGANAFGGLGNGFGEPTLGSSLVNGIGGSMFDPDAFLGSSSSTQQEFRQYSNVTPSEYQSLQQHAPRPSNSNANSHRHSYMEPCFLNGSSMPSDFGVQNQGLGRLSVPPENNRNAGSHIGNGFDFPRIRTSTENMYDSEETFKRCTTDMFKTIWSQVPNELPPREQYSNGPSAHASSSTGLSGEEFLRHAAPPRSEERRPSAQQQMPFKFKPDTYYGRNYELKHGYNSPF